MARGAAGSVGSVTRRHQGGMTLLEELEGVRQSPSAARCTGPGRWDTDPERLYAHAGVPVRRDLHAVVTPDSAALDLATLQDLNARVQVGGEQAKTVALDFLTKNGFVK